MNIHLVRWPIVSLLLALLAVFPVSAATVPVTVHLSFDRADSALASSNDSGSVPAGDAWIFVLDHSGSMDTKDAMVDSELAPSSAGKAMKRWDALLLALKATLDQIEPGSLVQIVKVGGASAELSAGQKGFFVHNGADREKLFESVKSWRGPRGQTPLYHGLFLACQEAQRFIKNENRNACIVVFSDGKDESNRKYQQKHIDSFKSLFEEVGFNACLNWVSTTSAGLPPPPFGPKFFWSQPTKDHNVIPVICSVRPRFPSVSLKSPLATGGRADVQAPFSFSLSSSRWDTLLAEGFDANVGLKAINGTDIGGDVVRVRKGATSADIVFQIPDTFFDGGKGAMFDLCLSLPESAKGCRFIQSSPVCLSFEEQGAVTLSSVKPESGLVAKVGESISFAAAGTEGAAFSWTFGDGASAKGAKVVHSFAAPAPGGISFSVAAEKSGLTPATQSGTVVVVEAGVKLDPVPTGLKVGDTAVFSCRGQGEVASYDWFVDGAPVIGEDAKDGGSSRLSVPLSAIGDHTVRVRANMKRVSPEETPEVSFSVAPAPFAAIVKPEPNERFAAESVIPLEASVEGGFASGVWTVRDATDAVVGKPIPAPVVDKVAKANFPAPEAGGDFTVSFVVGEGGSAVAATPAPFSVKAKNVRLDVVSPVKDSPVRTGAPCELKAASAGLSGSVSFFLVDESSGGETRIADVKIAADGSAAVSHIFPVKDGQGERTLVAKTADGKVVSDPVPFVLETDADLRLKSPANNAQVEYGGTLVFEAAPSGVIQARDVQWFLRPAGGAEMQIKGGTGAKYEHVFSAVPNRKGLTYEVFARAFLPDGSPLETDHVTVRASCPDILATLDIPREIAPGVEFSVRLKFDPKSAPAKTVAWNFGDGTTNSVAASDVVKHTYRKAGSYNVSVVAVCASCGTAYPSGSATITVQCPDLNPVLVLTKEADSDDDDLFSRGKPIQMTLSFETPGAAARAADIRWDFGDGTSEANHNVVSHSYPDDGEKTVSVSVRCATCNRIETARTSFRIDLKPPKAHFRVCRSTASDRPVGNLVSQGTTVALVDKSTGDVSGRRWFCDGERLAEFDDKEIAEWDCRTTGKHVFSLVTLDPNGVESAPETHSIRVYRGWLVLLLLLLASVASGCAWYYFSGDDPRFWKLSTIVSDDDSLDETGALDAMPPGGGKPLSKFWETRNNRAIIPLAELGGRIARDDWGKNTANGEARLCLFESMIARQDGDRSNRQPQAKLEQTPQGMLLRSYNRGHLLQISAVSPSRSPELTSLWVKIDTSKRNATSAYLWYRIGLLLLFFGIAFVLISAFAA